MFGWPLVLLGGVVSGVASNFVDYFVGYAANLFMGVRVAIFIGPGICFGAMFLAVLKMFQKLPQEVWKSVVFVLISVAAYNAAYWSAILSMGLFSDGGSCGWGPCDSQMYGGIFIGGIVGALIFVLSAKLLFKVFSTEQLLILLVISGVLGVLGLYSNNLVDIFRVSGGSFQGPSFPSLLVVWQTGMIAMMYYYLKKDNSV